jgi:hypothetical protein
MSHVLCLFLEFAWWNQARSWTYSAQLGLEEGMRANGARPHTVTSPWLPRLRELCGDRRFDQVWVEVVHQDAFDEDTMSWIAERAPVRVGFVPESLTYDEDVYAEWPSYRTRSAEVKRRLTFLTHAICSDEKDAEDIDAEGRLKGAWWPTAVPRRYIVPEVETPAAGAAIFAGALYGRRKAILEDEALRGLVVLRRSPEVGTQHPRLFDRLHMIANGWVSRRFPSPRTAAAVYLFLLRRLRRRAFRGWLQSLREGIAVVNPPHVVGAYPGRVIEAMAAGRPVVSWDVPHRPRNRALFEDSREILLFSGTDPVAIAEPLRRLQRDSHLRRTIAESAWGKVRQFHTMERRIQQVFTWIEKGDEPVYN